MPLLAPSTKETTAAVVGVLDFWGQKYLYTESSLTAGLSQTCGTTAPDSRATHMPVLKSLSSEKAAQHMRKAFVLTKILKGRASELFLSSPSRR